MPLAHHERVARAVVHRRGRALRRRSTPTTRARRGRRGRTRTRSPRPGSAATSRRPRRTRTGPRRAAPRARSLRARPPSARRPRAACGPRPRTRSRPPGRGRAGGRSSRAAARPAGPPTARARRRTAACPPARLRAGGAPPRPQSASSTPGSASASLLSSTTHSAPPASACRIAALLPPEKPRLRRSRSLDGRIRARIARRCRRPEPLSATTSRLAGHPRAPEAAQRVLAPVPVEHADRPAHRNSAPSPPGSSSARAAARATRSTRRAATARAPLRPPPRDRPRPRAFASPPAAPPRRRAGRAARCPRHDRPRPADARGDARHARHGRLDVGEPERLDLRGHHEARRRAEQRAHPRRLFRPVERQRPVPGHARRAHGRMAADEVQPRVRDLRPQPREGASTSGPCWRSHSRPTNRNRGATQRAIALGRPKRPRRGPPPSRPARPALVRSQPHDPHLPHRQPCPRAATPPSMARRAARHRALVDLTLAAVPGPRTRLAQAREHRVRRARLHEREVRQRHVAGARRQPNSAPISTTPSAAGRAPAAPRPSSAARVSPACTRRRPASATAAADRPAPPRAPPGRRRVHARQPQPRPTDAARAPTPPGCPTT